MAERFSYSQAQNDAAPMWALDQLLAPGSGYGWTRDQGKRRGDVRSELIDPLGMIQGGSEKYGLADWGSLFGEGGEILDPNALLRSLNFGNVVGQEGSRGNPGDRGGWSFGDSLTPYTFKHSPTSGNISYDESDPLQAWLQDISFAGKDRGRSWTGRHKTDVPGYWYDPGNLRFGSEDLAGIETLDQLDQWAMQNYGVDAQTLGAMSDELLNTRQAFAEDPSLWWNDGFVDVTGDVAGLNDIDLQARLAGIMEDYDVRQAQYENQFAQQIADMASAASSGNRHLGRTSYGQALGELVPEAVGLPGQLSGLSQPGLGYDYGLAEAFRPYLESLQEAQFRYG